MGLLFSRPILTANQVTAELETSYPATARHINTLVAEGLLVEITGQTRNRIFQADAVIDAIAAPLPAEGL